MIRVTGFHCFRTSDIQSELPQTELLLRSFLCFYAAVCVFSCCRQQTVIPLSLPRVCGYVSVNVCVCPFFPGLENAGLHVYVWPCVCMRDVQRNAL